MREIVLNYNDAIKFIISLHIAWDFHSIGVSTWSYKHQNYVNIFAVWIHIFLRYLHKKYVESSSNS